MASVGIGSSPCPASPWVRTTRSQTLTPVWRIPRRLTEEEIRAHLTNLPAIFPELGLYFCFEAVEEARAGELCVIDLLRRSG
jgi:hypothetical protein